jgi:hypothetical protein
MSVDWHAPATVMMLERLETPDSYVPGGPVGSTNLADAIHYVTTLRVEDRLRAAIAVGEEAGTSKTLLEVADIEGLAARRDFPEHQTTVPQMVGLHDVNEANEKRDAETDR